MNTICDYIIADAPFPPSLNALFEPHKIGRRCSVGKSSRYKRWQRDVFNPWWMSIRAHGKIDFGRSVMVWSVICPPRRGVDVDNYSKCFLDCLEAAGGIENDNLIVSLHNEKGPRVSGGHMRVFIASERHRDLLMNDFWDEFFSRWLPRRDGEILRPVTHYRHRRAAFVESQHPAVSQC